MLGNEPDKNLAVALRASAASCQGAVDNGCCAPDTPCGKGDGDCDDDAECQGDLGG